MKKHITKNIILVNCIIACVMLILAGSLAAYTSLSNAKRTVSTVGSKQLFSSNILLQYDEDANIQKKSISFSSEATENKFIVSVCNYAQGNKTKWSSEDIAYSLYVKLLDANGVEVTDPNILAKYTFGRQDDSATILRHLGELEQPVTATLSSGAASEDMYSITVPSEYMKDYSIKMTAVPQNSNKYKSLGRIMTITENIAQAKWSINFLGVEQAQDAYDLGCINTVLAGSEHATLTLKWDAKHIDIDPWFLKDMRLSDPAKDAEGWKSITFEAGGVDAENNSRPNRYNITFYRTKGVHSDDTPAESWDDIEEYIKLESTTITE